VLTGRRRSPLNNNNLAAVFTANEFFFSMHVKDEVPTMEIVSDHAAGRAVRPNEDDNTKKQAGGADDLDKDFGKLSVQNVAELAAAAHSSDGGGGGDASDNENEQDAHTDLLQFPPVSRHTSFKSRMGGLNVPPRRAQSMRADRTAMMGAAGADFTPPGQTLRRSHSQHKPHRGVGRASSGIGIPSGSLSRNRSIRRAPPGRSVSTDGSLRGFRRDQLVNVSIQSRDRPPFDRKEYGVMRTRSGDDLSSVCSGLDSCFTTDSINLRKSQLIADPIEGMYNDYDSCADHDTLCDTFSQYTTDFDGYTEHLPDGRGRSDDSSFCTLESFQIRGASVDEGCDVSLFSHSNSNSLSEDFDLEETVTESFEENPTEVEGTKNLDGVE